MSPLSAGFARTCPRCGQAPLFDGFIKVKDHCPACGLDYSEVDSGDGPAFFVMSIVGFVVVASAAWVEIAYRPALWIHMALWLPATLALTVWLLPIAKATLVASQYLNKAAEGRLSDEP